MYGKELEIVETYKYLGILLSSVNPQNTLFREHFARIMDKAQRRIECIKHFGYHKDGLRPQTAIRMYKILVRPLLEYGAQVLSYQRYYLKSSRPPGNIEDLRFFKKDLEHFQTRALKNLLNCPRNTSPSVVRLLAGVEPMACRIDMLKLRYFWKSHTLSPVFPGRLFPSRKEGFSMLIRDMRLKHLTFAAKSVKFHFGMAFTGATRTVTATPTPSLQLKG